VIVKEKKNDFSNLTKLGTSPVRVLLEQEKKNNAFRVIRIG
jgi:hypothetical protein